jgi:hypothetical protein
MDRTIGAIQANLSSIVSRISIKGSMLLLEGCGVAAFFFTGLLLLLSGIFFFRSSSSSASILVNGWGAPSETSPTNRTP